MLDALGHPERRLPPVIHVAGTNGKGSTIAFMRAILEAAGLRVHVYTSPHLVRFNERFRLGAVGDGKLVSDDALADALAECERANARRADHRVRDHHGGGPAAVRAPSGRRAAARGRARRPARRHQCGGAAARDRDHAGVARPCRISRRHASRKIAAEKAGILKRDVPAIVAAQPREALAVIERAAARVQAPIRIAGEDWTATEERGRLVYQDDDGLLDLPAPKLYGRHQFENAGARDRRAARRRRLEASRRRRSRPASRTADWPARMQRLVARQARGAAAGRAASCGSTAATMPTAGAPSPTRWPISRSACRARSCWSSACWRRKDSQAFLKNFAGLARAWSRSRFRIRRRRCRPRPSRSAARAVGIPAASGAGIEAALAAIAQFGLDAAAAHSDHRLALSRRRSAGRERHAAGLILFVRSPVLCQQLHQVCLLLLHLLHACIGAAPCRGASAGARVPWRKRPPVKWS